MGFRQTLSKTSSGLKSFCMPSAGHLKYEDSEYTKSSATNDQEDATNVDHQFTDTNRYSNN